MAGAWGRGVRVMKPSKVLFNYNILSFCFPETVLGIILKSTSQNRYNYFLMCTAVQELIQNHTAGRSRTHIWTQISLPPRSGPCPDSFSHACYPASLADISAVCLTSCYTVSWLLWPPFYRWRVGDSEELSVRPKVTQVVSDRIRFQFQVCLFIPDCTLLFYTTD